MQALLIAARFGFGLDRGVVYIESAFEHFDHSAPDSFGVIIVANGHMSGQTGIVTRNRPKMKVVDLGYALHLDHSCTDSGQVKPARHALQQDMGGVAQQSPCAGQHPKANGDGDDGVNPIELRPC